MMQGLPGSGKTTLARELAAAKKTKRVSKDDFRRSMPNKGERQVHAAWLFEIERLLSQGYSVIADATNLALPPQRELEAIAMRNAASVERRFLNTPLSVCIERDSHREAPEKVGAPAIVAMHKRYLES